MDNRTGSRAGVAGDGPTGLPRGPVDPIVGPMWPVLQRELREQARQDITYWLRVIAGGVIVLLFWLAWEREANAGQAAGRGYFLGLHRCLFLGIWFVGPVLTADCLSRERREGTLGLLFLTPLRPVDVVVGKAFVHALRGLSFVLAAVPVMVVPVLLGGVGWMEAVRMTLLQFAALGLALVAGLAASALTESWWRSRLLAFGFAALGAGAFVALYIGIQVLPGLWAASSGPTEVSLWDRFSTLIGATLARQGILLGMGFNGLWQDWNRGSANWTGLRNALALLAASWTLVALAVVAAAGVVRRTWRNEPGSARSQTVARWLTEVHWARRWYQSRQSAALKANPVRWLQSRTWSARVGGWVLLGMALSLTGAALEAPRDMAQTWYFFGQWILLGGAAFAAAASFREERESGALELWLVTPLTPTEMVTGRIVGLVQRFLVPTLLILLLPLCRYVWRGHVLPWIETTPRPIHLMIPQPDWLFAGWVAATLVFGTGLALARLSFLTSFVLAWVAHHCPFVVTAVLDWANGEAMERWREGIPRWDPASFQTSFSIALAAGVTLWGGWFAQRQLAERRYLPGMHRTA